jgi:methyl-accepting chemotaxis protein
VFRFLHLKIGAKLGLLAATGIVSMLVIAAVSAVNLRNDLMAARIAVVRNVVESAAAVAAQHQQAVEAGRMTQDEALAAYAKTVNAMRFDGGQEYLFTIRSDGIVLAHPKPDLVGTSMANVPDKTGKLFIREMIEVAKRDGAGTVDYAWPRAGSDAPLPKVGYVKAFAPWDMLIGSGVYVDDVEAEFRARLLTFGAMALALGLLAVGVAYGIARSVSRPLAAMTGAMSRLAAGDAAVAVPGAGTRSARWRRRWRCSAAAWSRPSGCGPSRRR